MIGLGGLLSILDKRYRRRRQPSGVVAGVGAE
jgi:hypothetical protein